MTTTAAALRITEDVLLAPTYHDDIRESLTFHWLKNHCLTLYQAVIGKYSNSILGIYQVVIYSKQVYTCDFTRVSTNGFTSWVATWMRPCALEAVKKKKKDLLTVRPKFTRPACRATPAAVDRYQLAASVLSSKPAGRRCCRSTGQTDGQTLDRFLWRSGLPHRPTKRSAKYSAITSAATCAVTVDTYVSAAGRAARAFVYWGR